MTREHYITESLTDWFFGIAVGAISTRVIGLEPTFWIAISFILLLMAVRMFMRYRRLKTNE